MKFLALLAVGAASLYAADAPWPWAGSFAKDDVTMLLLGDVNVEQRTNPADAMVHVAETLRRADLVYGNLEGLLVKSQGPDQDLPDKTGWQHIGPEAVQALKAGNIQVVGVANNVSFGPSNIMRSLAVLDANKILHTGAGENVEEAHKPAIVTRKGVRIGFLQYTAKWYAQDQQIAAASRPGVARIMSRDGETIDQGDLNRLREDIRRLRPQVDILIVSSHNRDGMGRPLPAEVAAESRVPSAGKGASSANLFAPIPLGPQFSQTEAYQKVLAHSAIDAGADIVYGHGSHVLQGVDVYKGKPVMYCLGNFATDWIRMRPNKEGMVARVVIHGKHVAYVSLVPVTRDADHNNVIMLDPSSGEGERSFQKVKSLSGATGFTIKGQEIAVEGITQPSRHR